MVKYPTILGMSAPERRAYPPETVAAEKLQAMVQLGMANSRMKDIFDLWIMGRDFAFDGEILRAAIAATFARRKTELPSTVPVALTATFSKDETKNKQWRAFCIRGGLKAQSSQLEDVVKMLGGFLFPPLLAAAREELFSLHWAPGRPWSPTK